MYGGFADPFSFSPPNVRDYRTCDPLTMDAGVIALIVAGVALAVASAALSAVETAIFSMTQERRRKLRVRDARRAAALERLMERPDDVANALVLANTLTNLPLLVLLLFLASALGYADRLSGWGLIALGFVVVVVLCDLAPKLAALAAPVRTTRLGLPLVENLVRMLRPAIKRLHRWSDRLVAMVSHRIAPLPYLTDEEIETLLVVGQEEGTFGETEARILQELTRLADKPARHCMTPRVDAFTLTDDLTNEEAAQIVRRKRYRFVPVRGESPDDILGLLDVREFLLHPSASHYTERLRPPSFVPESMKVLDLLRAFLGHRQHLAILLDEFGGIKGMVTLSDIVEELLGEEGPAGGSELYLEPLGEGRLLAAGNARLDDIAEHTGLEPESREIETIGGLVAEHFGSVPRPGESFLCDGWRITVRRATRKRVREVLIEPVEEGAK
jgi:CBS domain containing-hemolysin-like protein